MQGDTVREGRIKETMPKGQARVPWASILCMRGVLNFFPNRIG